LAVAFIGATARAAPVSLALADDNAQPPITIGAGGLVGCRHSVAGTSSSRWTKIDALR
jgi:hypothetical protein